MLFRSRKTGKFCLFTVTLLVAVFSLSIFICCADTDLSDAPVILETASSGSSGAAQEIGGNRIAGSSSGTSSAASVSGENISGGNLSAESASGASDEPVIGENPVISGSSGSSGTQSSSGKKTQEITSGSTSGKTESGSSVSAKPAETAVQETASAQKSSGSEPQTASSAAGTGIFDAPAAIGTSGNSSSGSSAETSSGTASGTAAGNHAGTSSGSSSGTFSGSIISSAPFVPASSQNTQAPQAAVAASSSASVSESTSAAGQNAPSSAAQSAVSTAGPSSGKSSQTAGANHANDAVTRVSLDFSLITPTHTKGNLRVARGAVKLDDGTWQELDYSSGIHYAFYMYKDTETDDSGSCWYVASVRARRFGDTCADDGEMKTELWLKASDCIVRSSIDIGTTDPTRIAIVRAALSCIGKQYVYGGNGPEAYDCSGLAKYIYKKAGITVPRTSTQMLQMDGEICAADLRPGDLMVRSGHCGIYIGNGIFVHASDSSVGVVAEYLSVYNLSNKFTNYFNVVGD